jgi:hypothetical protein
VAELIERIMTEAEQTLARVQALQQ